MKIKDIIKVADFFTIGNLICGMLTMFLAIMNEFKYAALLLFIAVLFDVLDGKIARMSESTSVQKEFGVQLDSLADIVSFGVAPAILGFAIGLYQWYAIVIMTFFVIAGMLRLARYNVTESIGYEGVPITVNGVLFPILFLISMYYPYSFSYWLVAYACMGVAMMSTIKIKKLI